MCFNWPVLHLEPKSAWGYLSFGKMWCDTFITESWSSKQISMPEVFNRNGNVLPSNIKYASIPQWVAMLYNQVQTANPVNHTCWVIHHILNWGLVSHARGLWYSILVLLSTLRTIAPPFCCIYFAFCYLYCYLQPQIIILYIDLNKNSKYSATCPHLQLENLLHFSDKKFHLSSCVFTRLQFFVLCNICNTFRVTACIQWLALKRVKKLTPSIVLTPKQRNNSSSKSLCNDGIPNPFVDHAT